MDSFLLISLISIPIALVLVVIALRSSRFVSVLALSALSAGLISSTDAFTYGLTLLFVAAGGVAFAAGAFLRKQPVGLPLLVIGLYLATPGWNTLARELDTNLRSGIELVIALVLTATASTALRSRRAAPLALLAMFFVPGWHLDTLFSPSLMMRTIIAGFALAAFATVTWALPRARWTRIATYFSIAIAAGSVSAIFRYSFFPDNFDPAIQAQGGLLSAAVMATLAFIARKRLFEWPEEAASADLGAARSSRQPVLTTATSPQASSAAHTPSDVFISYKRDERARVEQIARALRELKLSVWFDAKLQSGRSFDDEINREVRSARCVLVCWSPGAVASEWVRAEASVGRQRGVLTACFLEACEPYTPFNLLHAEDLSTGALESSNGSWVKLVDQIGRMVGRPGLGEYLELGGDKARAGAWLAENAGDPLADGVLARLRQT